MATVLELLNDLATKAGLDVNDPELKALLSSTSLNVNVSDKIVNQINKGLLTKDAALNDPEVYKQLDAKSKGKYFGILDNKVNQLLVAFNDYLTDEQKAEIKSTEDTPSKYDLINKYLPSAVTEKSKTAQGKKATEEDIRRIEAEYNDKIKTIRDEVTNEWQTKYETREKEFKSTLISKDLTQKIFSFNLIDNIPGGKDFLANAIINDLSKEYTLKANEKGGIDLRRSDDPEKEVFVNNTKLTVDTVLSEKLKDFVKKSDTQNNVGNQQGSPFPVPQKPAATLNDFARQQAQNHAAQELARLKQAS